MLHGGDTVGYRHTYGREPLDFSANVNPLGVPEGVQRAIAEAFAHADRYPDPPCRDLCARIAQAEDIPTEWVLCGNGAADLIYRVVLAQRPLRALLPSPSFAEYEQALALAGCDVRHHALLPEDSFAATQTLVDALAHERYDIVFLCNPNNPTGLLIEPALMAQMLETCARTGTLMVMDECFMGFVANAGRHTVRRQLENHANLLVLDAFTKRYGMAGIRLGYALCSDTSLLARMDRAGAPWSVSSLAQAAGMAALAAQDYLAQTMALIGQERAFLRRELTALGLDVLSGEANYLFVRTTIEDLGERLRQQGIMIRGCANYRGLDDTYYRMAVRTRPENLALLQALSNAGLQER